MANIKLLRHSSGSVVCHLADLSSLYCSYGTFSDLLFTSVPSTLHTLGIQTFRKDVPVDALVSAMKLCSAISLRTLVITRCSDTKGLESISDACKDAGVTFWAVAKHPLLMQDFCRTPIHLG